MNNSIINSLKRLERVGQETSRVTKKLKLACEEVGELLEEKLEPFKNNKSTDSYMPGNKKIAADVLPSILADF